VDRAGILCEKDRTMLYEFSRRSFDRLAGHSLLTSLPFFSAYYDANIKKESDKDRLIITIAAAAFDAGRPACDLDLEDIFERTKTVDKAFLENLLIPSFSLSVRYGDIADIRIQRIWRISKAVYDLLKNWPESSTFVDAVRNAYTEREFKEVLMDILRLYNEETRMLDRSLVLLPPLSLAMSSFSGALFQAMDEATEGMADTYTKIIFGDINVYA
jgi:hypothetical protein